MTQGHAVNCGHYFSRFCTQIVQISEITRPLPGIELTYSQIVYLYPTTYMDRITNKSVLTRVQDRLIPYIFPFGHYRPLGDHWRFKVHNFNPAVYYFYH